MEMRPSAAVLLVAGIVASMLGLVPAQGYAVANGDLDPSFGTGGKVTTDIWSSGDVGQDVAVQSDGKIVVAGYSYGGSDQDFALVRYDTDGTLDTSFGTDGIVKTTIGATDDQAHALAIQPDGKIVVAGASTTSTNNSDSALVRYNTDGTLDTSFGTGGKIVTAVAGTNNDCAYAVAIQSDGKIVAVGSAWTATLPYSCAHGATTTGSTHAIARYNTNGSLDTTFSGDGLIVGSVVSGAGRAVAIQADGKIVVGQEDDSDFLLFRYNSNGTLDPTFGSSGQVTTGIGPSSDVVYALAIQSDGRIVAAGYSLQATEDFALVRYNTDGSLDTSFGTDGKVTTPLAGGEDEARGVAIQADGKILLAGYTNYGGGNHDFALVRYNTDGSLDASFGTGGKVMTSFGARIDDAFGIALQTDDRIVVAGSSNNGSTDDFAVTRYVGVAWPETTIDSGPSGTVGSPSATFAFSSDNPSATFLCDLDGGGYSACTSPKGYAGLVDGSHTFFVRAKVDTNQDPTPASRTWTIDTRPATTLSISAPSKVSAGSRATISGTLSSADAACTNAQQVTLKNGSATAGTATTSATGAYRFKAKITKKTSVQVAYAGTASCAPSASVKKTIKVV